MEGALECCLALLALLQTTTAALAALDIAHRRRARRLRILARERERASDGRSGALMGAYQHLSSLHRLRRIRGPTLQRRCWVHPASDDWWERFVLTARTDERWKANFRMPRSTFNKLVDLLRPQIAKQDTIMRRAIPVEKRVALTLWLLAHRCSYRSASHHFGVGRSTVADIFVEVILAMELILLPRTIFLGDVRKIMDGFTELGFPQVVGAVDGCHVQIVSPVRQGGEFINKKNTYSILLQGTCDHTGRFVDTEIGWSGRYHEARVIRNSAIYDTMEAGVFVPGNPTITLCGKPIGPLLLSDSVYPIRKWLMKPYQGTATPKQALFNKRLNCARSVVESAFGRLKARWRCLTASLEVAEENVSSVIAACVILHNVCETGGKVLEEDPQHISACMLDTLGAPLMENEAQKKAEGEAVRDALANYFWEQRN